MVLQTEVGFRNFFNSFYPGLVRFCHRYVRDAERSRDIAQDAFVRLYERRKDFGGENQIKSFLYETAKNMCFDWLKHRVVEEKYIRHELHAKDAKELSHDIIREEVLHALKSAIHSLPPQSRRVMEESLKGKKNAEIAEILGIAETSVKTLKRLAYIRLREQLSPSVFLICTFFLK